MKKFQVGDRVRSRNTEDLKVNPEGPLGTVVGVNTDWFPYTVLLDGDSSRGCYLEEELDPVVSTPTRKYSNNEINEIIMLLCAHSISDKGMNKAADMLKEFLNVTNH